MTEKVVDEVFPHPKPLPPGEGGGAVQALARRDEVLELLFWMKGEGFGDALAIEDLARFLTFPRPEIARALESLAAAGAVERRGGRFALTDAGLPEARRRFVDEFREMLSGAHGECNFSCEESHDHGRDG